MLKNLGVILAVLMLTGCEKPVSQVQQFGVFKVVEIKRPKHFRVVLENTETGTRHKVGVSKHCNSWRELKLGTIFKFNTEVSTYADGSTYTYFFNKQRICPGKL